MGAVCADDPRGPGTQLALCTFYAVVEVRIVLSHGLCHIINTECVAPDAHAVEGIGYGECGVTKSVPVCLQVHTTPFQSRLSRSEHCMVGAILVHRHIIHIPLILGNNELDYDT